MKLYLGSHTKLACKLLFSFSTLALDLLCLSSSTFSFECVCNFT